ncbi:translation protein SH3-like domain-containing protein [Trichophaea hybrida]|nr:translation protein SH3-like domain-containing protein [Trichophaea hybrida]
MMITRPLSRLILPRPASTPFLRGQFARFQSSEVQSSKPEEPTNSFAATFTPPPNRDEKGFAMKTYKPRTPGVRHLVRTINDHLWKGRPIKYLTVAKKGHGKGGRNHTGRVTVRHHGGGHKRRIRMVDFFRSEPGAHRVERIERDPGRSGHIALLTNEVTGAKSYILAADGLRAGDVVQSYRSGIPVDLVQSMGGIVDPGMLAAKTAWRGNCLPLHMIPIGTLIHAIGSSSRGPAVFCRSAVGEVRKVKKDACATIGVVSNPTWQHRQLGKAGRSRWLNIRPTVRGVAMNASDHPHGGGRGKSKGNRHPVSPWGIPTKSGYKTRSVGNPNRWVVVPRVRNQGKRRAKS